MIDAFVLGITVMWALAPGVAVAPGAGACDARKVEEVLPNGVRVEVEVVPATRTGSVSMKVEVGQIDDPPGRRGMAHLVEHLLTGPLGLRLGGGQTLEETLSQFAGRSMGNTGMLATTYQLFAPAKQLERLLWLAAEQVAPGWEFSDRDVRTEVDATREEFRQRNTPERTRIQHTFWRGVMDRIWPGFRALEPASDRYIERALGSLGADEVRGYMMERVATAPLTVRVKSPYPAATVVPLARKWFAPLPERAAPSGPERVELKPIGRVVRHLPGIEGTRLTLVWSGPRPASGGLLLDLQRWLGPVLQREPIAGRKVRSAMVSAYPAGRSSRAVWVISVTFTGPVEVDDEVEAGLVRAIEAELVGGASARETLLEAAQEVSPDEVGAESFRPSAKELRAVVEALLRPRLGSLWILRGPPEGRAASAEGRGAEEGEGRP